jgi:uncharacterized membrane protein (UPF0127 family)
MRAGFLAPIVKRPDVTFSLRNAATGAVVATRVETAFDSRSRRQGLLGRDGLPAGTAFVIAPSNAVHTFFMRFSIDVLFVRSDGSVLKVRRSMPPGRVAVSMRAFAVIELSAEATGVPVRRGDRLELTGPGIQ